MATDHTSDDTSDRFSLLELDLPSKGAAPRAPAPRPAPAPTPAPAPAPTDLERGRALLTSATTEAALDNAVRTIVTTYPDANHPIRAALRPVYRERLAALVALWWVTFLAAWRGIGLHVGARVYHPNTANTTPAPVMTPAPTPTAPTPVMTQSAPAPAPLSPPHRGEYRKHNDKWCGWIAHTGRAVRPGDRVVLVRKNGAETREYVRSIISSTHHGGCLIEFGAAPEAPQASAPQAQPAPQPQPTTLTESTGSLADALGIVVGESVANAATQASGSMRDGTMRGVGFSSAAGYVQALANGVKRATADGYLATLRGSYGYTDAQIAELTVTIIPEATLPVGKGITVDNRVNGKSIFDLPAAQRRQLVTQRKTVYELPKAEDLLVTRIKGARQPRQFSWSGAGRRGTSPGGGNVPGAATRAQVIERLALVGLTELAPKAKRPVAHAGHAVRALNVGGLVARRAKGNEEYSVDGTPCVAGADVAARWVVGRLGRSDVALVVDLLRDRTLRTTGDEALGARVRADYQARIDGEVYQSGELTTWLQDVLRMWYSAAQNGVNWYVPAEYSDDARVLARCLAGRDIDGGALWGASWCCGQAVTTEEELIFGLAAGFLDDLDRLAEDFAKARETNVGARGMNTLLARVDDAAETITRSYAKILGADHVEPLRTRLAALRAEIEPLIGDDSTQRARMLELDIDDEE